MAVTLTANYQQVLNADTIEKIDELLEENHDLQCMLTFIDEHNESDFVAYYEEYVRCGEIIGYEAVDALIEEQGDVCYVEDCDERYVGHYQSTADFAEEWVTETLDERFPEFVVIDWSATWDCNLRYDFTACNDGSTYCPIHIFRNY